MQKIEKWRVEELALVLNELADLLMKGENPEWANVFSHFHLESKKIITKQKFNLDSLKNLVKNTKNCFYGGSSFINIELHHDDLEKRKRINQDLRLTRARLLKILSDIEKRVIETVN